MNRENLNLVVDNMLNRRNVIEVYDDMIHHYLRKEQTVFIELLQVYVTKLGIILSEALKGLSARCNTYMGSIDYICQNVLRNRDLFYAMKSTVNHKGNIIKHNIKNIDIFR